MKHQKYWDEFINNIGNLQSSKDLIKFFELVITPAEQEKIALRRQILAELIANKKTQREIAKEIGVSVFNVTRGSNQLKLVDNRAKQLITINK